MCVMDNFIVFTSCAPNEFVPGLLQNALCKLLVFHRIEFGKKNGTTSYFSPCRWCPSICIPYCAYWKRHLYKFFTRRQCPCFVGHCICQGCYDSRKCSRCLKYSHSWFFHSKLAIESWMTTLRCTLPELIKVNLWNSMNGVSWNTTSSKMTTLCPLSSMCILQWTSYFFCKSHTEVCKPYVLPKKLNFIQTKNLATLQGTTNFFHHNPNGFIS